MKNLLFVLFDVTLQANCTRKKCNYNQDINTISVRHWYKGYCPRKGKVCVYKKDGGFNHPVDSTRINKFEISTYPTIYESDTANRSFLVPRKVRFAFPLR